MPGTKSDKARGAPETEPAGAHGSDLLGAISAVSDVVIVTDAHGTVRTSVWNIEGSERVDRSAIEGMALEDTVTEECRPKIRQMLEAAAAGEAPRWREINHLIGGLGELPVRYQAIPAGGELLFVGRELRAVAVLQNRLMEAQRALDADYGRLRQLQTRYRVLFQTSAEPLLIADGRSRRIQEANAAAARLLGVDPGDLTGQPLSGIFAREAGAQVAAALERVITSGQPEVISGPAREGGDPIACRVSVFRAAEAMMLLCRPTRAAAADGEPAVEAMLAGVLDRIPDAVVLADRTGQIVWCNDAFLSLAETALASQVRGTPLARFLSRPGVDIDIVIENAAEHGAIRAFSSVMVGAYGSETPVEISVATLTESEPPVIGFVMRDTTRHEPPAARRNGGSGAGPGEGTDHMLNLVGTVPMKELVRASTEEIEKMCIEAALKKTGNNRASAAEMLGLSRQSLYVKLRRFGLLGSRDDDD